MTDIAGAAAAFFLWGLSRGLSTCLFLCAPGMIPIIVNEKAGLVRSLWLGFLLSLPRILVLTAMGAAIGLASFEVLSALPVRGSLQGVSIAAYIFLGLMLAIVGARMLSTYGLGEGAGNGQDGEGPKATGKGKAAKRGRKDGKAGDGKCTAPASSPWTRFWTGIADRLYPGKGRSASLFLLWGGVLSLACLAEVGLLEGTAIGALAGSGESVALSSAGIGALLMFVLSLGATVPIMAAAAFGGELVEKVRDRRRLEQIRGVMAMLMFLLGMFFVLREIYLLLVVTGLY
jgi:sulfite exporter TauE/SafE